jgi:hypothetical protein
MTFRISGPQWQPRPPPDAIAVGGDFLNRF